MRRALLLLAAAVLCRRPACADDCGTVELVGHRTHVESEASRVTYPVFRYQKDGEQAVVVKQDMRVNADGAVRSYAVDGHGFSYLCDGVTWRAPNGRFTEAAPCPAEAKRAMATAVTDGDVLRFSTDGPALCVFGFHVDGGEEERGCSGRVVGAGAGGRAPLVDVPTPAGRHLHFVATTAVANEGSLPGTPEHELDAARIPFIVRPGGWSEAMPDAAFELRDYAYVYSPGEVGVPRESLAGPRGVFAIVGDAGPRDKFGEGSIALHQLLAFGELRPAPPYVPTPHGAPHPQADRIFHPFRDSGDGDVRAKQNIERELWYIVFPRSRDAAAAARHTYEKNGGEITGNVQENGVRAATGLGGIEAIVGCLGRDPGFAAEHRR